MVDSKTPEVKAVQTTENEAVDLKVSETNDNTQEEVSTPKTYTSKEFNDAMAAIKHRAKEQASRKFEGVDVKKYRDLLQQEEDNILEEQKKRGEFEKILKDTAEKKDQRIDQLHKQLNSIKVDDALLQASAKHKAISPEQVVQLVKSFVKLNDTGDVEVVDKNGAPRYAESGEPLSIDLLMKEWLDSNPHFISAGPQGSGAKSNTQTQGITPVDISKLDMNDPVQRKLYAEHRKAQGIY